MIDLSRTSSRTATIDACCTATLSTFSHNRNTWSPSPYTVDRSRDGRARYTCAYNYSWTDYDRRSRRTSEPRLCDSIPAFLLCRKSRSNPRARGSRRNDRPGTSNCDLTKNERARDFTCDKVQITIMSYLPLCDDFAHFLMHFKCSTW